MRLGLLADVHERNDHLRAALRALETCRVEQVVLLGDVFELGEGIKETCRLLDEVRAVGVWGNHDFGLCNPDEHSRAAYPQPVLDFMARLRPQLALGECHFTHVEPWLDPREIADLWYFDGPPDTPDKLARSFAAVPQRFLFVGHFHRWLLAEPGKLLRWQGEEPITLRAQNRYLVVVGALCDGHFATFDTETRELTPWRNGERGRAMNGSDK